MKPADYNFRSLSRSEWSVFGLIAAAAVLSFLALNAAAFGDKHLDVYFLDVGQGDAIFIQSANGNQVLIDGGPDAKVITELSKVMPFNDRSIDLVILTHPDADHINGLIEVLKRYQVGQILENPIEHDSPAYAAWNELKIKSRIANAQSGQTVDIGSGAAIIVLYPFADSEPKAKSNNNSIIGKLVYGELSLLLTGDIEAQVERELVARNADIDSDLLKIPHHGSKTSSTDEFLKAVTPEAAFIQVGKDNRYGHPHPTVTQRLEKLGVKYYRTDMDGMVQLFLSQDSFTISKEK